MYIKVLDLPITKYNYDVYEHTIQKLKETISNEYYLPVDLIKLRHGNTFINLDDNSIISNIDNFSLDSLIHVDIRVLGGGVKNRKVRLSSVKKKSEYSQDISSMRDLNGRRLRHVMQEQQLKDYVPANMSKKEIQDAFISIKKGDYGKIKMCSKGANCKYKLTTCKKKHPEGLNEAQYRESQLVDLGNKFTHDIGGDEFGETGTTEEVGTRDLDIIMSRVVAGQTKEKKREKEKSLVEGGNVSVELGVDFDFSDDEDDEDEDISV